MHPIFKGLGYVVYILWDYEAIKCSKRGFWHIVEHSLHDYYQIENECLDVMYMCSIDIHSWGVKLGGYAGKHYNSKKPREIMDDEATD